MPPHDYRLYALSGTGGIGLADWIEAETDDQAIAQARSFRHGARKIEVWQQNRLVATLDGADVPA